MCVCVWGGREKSFGPFYFPKGMTSNGSIQENSNALSNLAQHRNTLEREISLHGNFSVLGKSKLIFQHLQWDEEFEDLYLVVSKVIYLRCSCGFLNYFLWESKF